MGEAEEFAKMRRRHCNEQAQPPYGQVSDLLDAALQYLSEGQTFDAIAKAEEAVAVMRKTQEIRSLGLLAPK